MIDKLLKLSIFFIPLLSLTLNAELIPAKVSTDQWIESVYKDIFKTPLGKIICRKSFRADPEYLAQFTGLSLQQAKVITLNCLQAREALIGKILPSLQKTKPSVSPKARKYVFKYAAAGNIRGVTGYTHYSDFSQLFVTHIVLPIELKYLTEVNIQKKYRFRLAAILAHELFILTDQKTVSPIGFAPVREKELTKFNHKTPLKKIQMLTALHPYIKSASSELRAYKAEASLLAQLYKANPKKYTPDGNYGFPKNFLKKSCISQIESIMAEQYGLKYQLIFLNGLDYFLRKLMFSKFRSENIPEGQSLYGYANLLLKLNLLESYDSDSASKILFVKPKNPILNNFYIEYFDNEYLKLRKFYSSQVYPTGETLCQYLSKPVIGEPILSTGPRGGMVGPRGG